MKFAMLFLCLLFTPVLRADLLSDQLIATVDLNEPPTKIFDFQKFQDLIAQGADINAQNGSGESVLLLATIDHGYMADDSPEKAKFLQAMQILISKNANVNAEDNLGLTPLMMAVHRAHTGAFGHPLPKIKPAYDVLLSAKNPKPDLELKNYLGQTALLYLARWGETEELQNLVSMGADIFTENSDGNNIFFNSASALINVSAVSFENLLSLVPAEKKQSILNKQNNSHTSLLMGAVRSGNVDIVQLLVEKYGVDVSPINYGHENALSIATASAGSPRLDANSKANYLKIIDILKAHGAILPPNDDPNVINCVSPNLEPFGFDKIQRIVNNCGIKSLDDLIPLFPVAHLSNYMLSYKPRGIQDGDFAHPRVVTLGSQGKSFLAFNGDPSQKGFDSLEMIEFKDDQNKTGFEFHEIIFNNGRVSYSPKNPAKCLACHGATDPRPRFDNWFTWPGFYFSEQSALYPIEKSHYVNDYLPNRNLGRYKNLLSPSDSPLDLGYGVFDYANTQKNIKMDTVLSDLNGEVIVSELTNSKNLQKYKYAILGAMSCPNRIEEFLPDQINKSMPRKYDDILTETKALDHEDIVSRVQRQAANLPGAPEGSYSRNVLSGTYNVGQSYETARISKLRYVIEGVGETMNWSTIFETKNHYLLFGVREMEYKLWDKWLSSSNPDEVAIRKIFQDRYNQLPYNFINYKGMFQFADYHPSVDGVDAKPVCDLLIKLSQASFGKKH